MISKLKTLGNYIINVFYLEKCGFKKYVNGTVYLSDPQFPNLMFYI
jgi:hypothetical protein